MSKHKVSHTEERAVEADAKKLLKSPRFFNEFLLVMKKLGLVGEELNALVLLIVVVSRLLQRPLSVFVKALSSAGKNWTVTRVLRLLPKDCIIEVTSASERAWNYAKSNLQHRVVYLQERSDAAGTVHPIRLLISERKIVRLVTRVVNGERITEKHVARGPVASISTSTEDRLEIDDENRHISIWIDESSEQTRQIVKSYHKQTEGLSRKELRTWRMVHRLLESRTGDQFVFPKWFDEVPDRLFVEDLRVRRYFPAFVEACCTVCLTRSFQSDLKILKPGYLSVDFTDFAIAALIFDQVFVESLHRQHGAEESTRRIVERISAKKGRPVRAKDLARKLHISLDCAYRQLRHAEKAGVIQRANEPERNNRKLFIATPRPRFVPDPEKLFRQLKDVDEKVRFVHPITGEWVEYRR
jgi:hypothetical protein